MYTKAVMTTSKGISAEAVIYAEAPHHTQDLHKVCIDVKVNNVGTARLQSVHPEPQRLGELQLLLPERPLERKSYTILRVSQALGADI